METCFLVRTYDSARVAAMVKCHGLGIFLRIAVYIEQETS